MPLHIVRNDIANMTCDAIVNTANPYPQIGAGTDSAIYEAAGRERLLAARRKIGRIAPGQAAATRGYGLKARYIIHTVGPVWKGGQEGEEQLLRSCYRTSLRIAKDKRCRTVAFPLISAGSYGYPKEEALGIAVEEIRHFLEQSNITVYLVVFGREAYELSGKFSDAVESFIDEHYVKEQTEAEYGGSAAGYLRRQNQSHIDYRRDAIERREPYWADEELTGMGMPGWRETDASAQKPSADDTVMDAVEAPYVQEEKEAQEAGAAAYHAKLTAMPSAAPKMGKDKASFPMSSFPNGKKRTLSDADLILAETFSETLMRFIDERDMTDVEVYKRANIDRKLFSKIRSRRHYQPTKKTALALAVALRLNLDQTKDLLSRAGYAISPSSLFDLIVEYFILNEVYDIDIINIELFDRGLPTLG